jgi:hypothetical protein
VQAIIALTDDHAGVKQRWAHYGQAISYNRAPVHSE